MFYGLEIQLLNSLVHFPFSAVTFMKFCVNDFSATSIAIMLNVGAQLVHDLMTCGKEILPPRVYFYSYLRVFFFLSEVAI